MALGLRCRRAGRGARALAARGLKDAEPQRDWMFAAYCRWVLGLVELSIDDTVAALWLDPIADMLQAGGIGEPGLYSFTPDLVEAWAAAGHLDRAADRLAWLQDAARRLDPVGPHHRRARRGRPAARGARPGRRHIRGRRCHR